MAMPCLSAQATTSSSIFGTAGLDDACDAGFGGVFDIVGEGEKGG